MTGADFKLEFERQINKSFSQYYTDAEQKELFRKALVLTIQDTYKNMSSQSDYDNMTAFIKTEQTFNLNNNRIYHNPIPITSMTIGATTTITTRYPHNFISGDIVRLSDVTGTISGINNQLFTVTVTGNATFTVTYNSTGMAHTANTGFITYHTDLNGVRKMIDDYSNLLSIKLKFNEVMRGVNITDATNSQPIVITVSTRNNNIKTGDVIRNIGIMGMSNANGEFYVRKAGIVKYELYYDINFMNGVSSNGKYAGGGMPMRVVYKSATPYFSNAKISPYDRPTINEPKFERGDFFIKTLPAEQVCQEVKADYISSDVIYIDPTDSTIDLKTKYPLEFLYMILNKAATLFYEETREFEAMQVSEVHGENNKKD